MKKLYLVAIVFLVALLSASCSMSESPNVLKEIPKSKPITPQDEYIALVESFIDGAEFKHMDENKTKQLSDMLLGHYNITGRTAGEGMDYYLATRLEDAPVYNDFNSIDIGYFSGPDTTDKIFQIGYYDKDENPVILYEAAGYHLLEMPLGNESLDCFCLGVNSSDEKVNHEFNLAFTQSGREQIKFIKKNVGLSFYSTNTSCIEFYYQDDDTLKFLSSQYSCYINISCDELEEIRGLFSTSSFEEGIRSRQDAWKYLNMKDNSIRTTGAKLHVDGKHYILVGNRNSTGYMISDTDEHDFDSLEYNEAIYKFVMNKIQGVVKMDYGRFDAKWFEIPLRSASIDFPERVEQADGSYISELRSQTVNDVEKLAALSKLMDKAINSQEIYGFSGCPYIATINFTRDDGETLRIFIATDSCDSMAYEGRIGFEYGKQSDLAAIFDDAMVYRITK